MNYPRHDARSPAFPEYVASGDKARDVYTRLTGISGMGFPVWQLFKFISQCSGGGYVRMRRDHITGNVHLSWIDVPSDQRGHGIGTAVMNAICYWADRRGWTLVCSPPDEFRTPLCQRFGFVPNHARFGVITRGTTTRDKLIRIPVEEK